MNIKNKVILIAVMTITSLLSYTYAGDPLQSFWNRIDRMSVEKRIDFYKKAIPMLQEVEDNPAATSILETMIKKYELLKNQGVSYITKVNYETIREEWLEKHNAVRSQVGVGELENNDLLNRSAQIRANYLATNTIPTGSTHKRESTDTYYDYDKILQWFGDQGVEFTNTNSTAFSENVGYGYYRACNDSDCTSKLLSETRSTRDFFIGEASRNGPHYRAMVQARYTQMGIGVGRNSSTKRYYVVVHYGVDTIQ